MFKPKMKHLLLAAAGTVLQIAGSLCVLLAVAGTAQDINTQIKRALMQELSKDLDE